MNAATINIHFPFQDSLSNLSQNIIPHSTYMHMFYIGNDVIFIEKGRPAPAATVAYRTTMKPADSKNNSASVRNSKDTSLILDGCLIKRGKLINKHQSKP